MIDTGQWSVLLRCVCKQDDRFSWPVADRHFLGCQPVKLEVKGHRWLDGGAHALSYQTAVRRQGENKERGGKHGGGTEERQRERQRETETETETNRQPETNSQRQTARNRQTDAYRQTDKYIQSDRHIPTDRHMQTDRHRQTDRHTHTVRQTVWHTKTDRQSPLPRQHTVSPRTHEPITVHKVTIGRCECHL